MKFYKSIIAIIFTLTILSGCATGSKSESGSNIESESSSESSEEVISESHDDRVFHTVTFNSNGGSHVESQRILHGEKVIRPDDPLKDGYTFTKWTIDGEEWSFIGYVVTSDITLFANYSPNEYVLSLYNTNEAAGRISGEGRYNYDSIVQLHAYPNDGYNFDGWYNDSDVLLSDAEHFNYTMSFSTTIVARWKYSTHELVVVSNNPSSGQVQVVSGSGVSFETVRVNAKPSSGYEVQRIEDKDGNILAIKHSDYPIFIKPDSWDDVYIYSWYGDTQQGITENAKWPGVKLGPKSHESIYELNFGELRSSGNTYSDYPYVYFILNSGKSGAGNQTDDLRFEEQYYPECNYIRFEDGKLVRGNAPTINTVDEDGMIDYSFEMPTSDYKLTFYFMPLRYEIGYDLSGGAFESDYPSWYFCDKGVKLVPALKTGYSFIDWLNESEEVVTKVEAGCHEDCWFHAAWNNGNVYHITLNPGEGELDNIHVDVQFDHPYELPTPKLRGYSIYGWEGFADNNEFYHLADDWYFVPPSGDKWPVPYDISLNAAWMIDNYTITLYRLYDGNPEDIETTIEYNVNSEEIVLPTSLSMKRTYNDFLGWYDEEGNKVTSIPAGSIGDVNLYARYSDHLYDIALSCNDEERGSVERVSGEYYYGNEISVKATPNEGYVFAGWYIDYNYSSETIKVSEDELLTFTINEYPPSELKAKFLTEDELAELKAEVDLKNGDTLDTIYTYTLGNKKVLSDFYYGAYPYKLFYKKNSRDTFYTDQVKKIMNEEGAVDEYGLFKFFDKYYFKLDLDDGDYEIYECSRIKWGINSSSDGVYYTIASYPLYASKFCDTSEMRYIDGYWVKPNSYQHSTIRNYLINDFYDIAFGRNSDSLVVGVGYNSSDYVALPTKSDYVECWSFITSDYAIKFGARDYNVYEYYPHIKVTQYGYAIWTMTSHDTYEGNRVYARYANYDGSGLNMKCDDWHIANLLIIRPTVKIKFDGPDTIYL